MKRDSFNRANHIYQKIQLEEENKRKLYGLKDQIIELLKGHIEIPEEKIFCIFREIKDLCGYLDKSIEELYQKIEKL